MLLDEVKATLAMENLSLNEEQEKLLKSYADGKITLKEYQELLLKLTKEYKAAWILEASSFDTVYCYPGTEVLINNFGEHDPKVLSQLEKCALLQGLLISWKSQFQGTSILLT